MRVEIWSDVVCPWCYIGKRRFEAALGNFEHGDEMEVLYRSYELDPNAPRSSGLDNYARLARKYGMSIEEARQRSAQLVEAGAQDGLLFDFDNVKQSNSFDAHRVLHLAATHGKQAEAMERLHRLYFSEGALIADAETLVEAAAEIGLPADETRAMLADPRAFADEVRADERLAGQFGLSGVPAFVIDRKYLISGAQASEYMLAALQQAWAEAPAAVGD